MEHIQAAIDLWSRMVELLRNHIPPERWPNATLWSALALPIGLIMAFWGARILRTVYVLGFMAAGAYVGMRVAQDERVKVDALLGLVLGAGLAGLIGHLLFRWWLGLTAGTLATLLVLVACAPRVTAEIQAFNDYQSGLSTGQYNLAQPKTEMTPQQQAQQYLSELKAYLWEKQPKLVTQFGVLLALAALLATAMGFLMPRFTMIVATSVMGVLMFAAGIGFFLSTRWLSAWEAMIVHAGWSLAACGILFLVAISYQARGPRAVAAAAPKTVAA
jgi:hypothetical protein